MMITNRTRPSRAPLECALTLAIALSPGLAAGEGEPVSVEIRDRQVWMETRDAPRLEALEALAEAAGFELRINAELPGTVSLRLEGVPIPLAVQRVSSPHSSVVLHETDAKGERRVALVTVYRRTPGGAATPSVSVRTQPAAPVAPSSAEEAKRLAELSAVLLNSQDSRAQRRAISEIRSIGGEAAVQALTPALDVEDLGIRGYAVAILGQIGSPSAVAQLGRVALADPDPDIRVRAIIALSRQHGEQARQLVEAATEDQDEKVREAATSRLSSW